MIGRWWNVASGLKLDLPVYTIDDEGLEQNGTVVGFTGKFVNHTSEQWWAYEGRGNEDFTRGVMNA